MKMAIAALLVVAGVAVAAFFGLMNWWQYGEKSKAVEVVVATYKEDPYRAQELVESATTFCLEEKVNGTLPSYFSEWLANSMLSSIKYAEENGLRSPYGQAYEKFKKTIRNQIVKEAQAVAARIDREPSDVQERIKSSINWINSDRKAVDLCVWSNVAKKLEPEAGS
ncbi:MAG TPA: hypothetical protein ENJ55_07095 [Rhizobiales bacterium]|nr:hypothetical protein [Hyphomicrobiales bacterium]